MKLKRIIALLLTVVMLTAAFGACGGKDSSGAQESSSKPDDGASTSAGTSCVSSPEETESTSYAKNGVGDTAYGPGEFKKYDEKITLTYGRVLDANSDGYLKMEEAGEPYTDNRWTRYFEEELNIGTEYSMITPNGVDYNQKLLLAMTSGTLPDVFYVSDLSVLK